MLYDGSEEKRGNYTLEGGDVHPLRPDLVVLGFTERSSPGRPRSAVRSAVRALRRHGRDRGRAAQGAHGDPPRHDLHAGRHASSACVYPPHFVGPERLAVLHRRKRSKPSRRCRTSSRRCTPSASRSSRCSAAGRTARPGAGAVVVRLQLLRGPARGGGDVRAQRGDAARDASRRGSASLRRRTC